MASDNERTEHWCDGCCCAPAGGVIDLERRETVRGSGGGAGGLGIWSAVTVADGCRRRYCTNNDNRSKLPAGLARGFSGHKGTYTAAAYGALRPQASGYWRRYLSGPTHSWSGARPASAAMADGGFKLGAPLQNGGSRLSAVLAFTYRSVYRGLPDEHADGNADGHAGTGTSIRLFRLFANWPAECAARLPEIYLHGRSVSPDIAGGVPGRRAGRQRLRYCRIQPSPRFSSAASGPSRR